MDHTEAIVAVQESTGLNLPGATETALTLPDLDYDTWRSVGHALGRLHKAHNWWIGDWLLKGEHDFGEKFAQAAFETGMSEEHLKNCQWVSGAYKPDSRRVKLTWTHHFYVAAIPSRDKWLAKAEDKNWSANQLQREVKGEKEKIVKAEHPEQQVLEAIKLLSTTPLEARMLVACLQSNQYSSIMAEIDTAIRYLRTAYDTIQVELVTRNS